MLIAEGVGLVDITQSFDDAGPLGLTLSKHNTCLLGLTLISKETGLASVSAGLAELGES